jgi:hypothetical protein
MYRLLDKQTLELIVLAFFMHMRGTQAALASSPMLLQNKFLEFCPSICKYHDLSLPENRN